MARLRELIELTHKRGTEIAGRIFSLQRIKRALEKLNAERRAQLAREEQLARRFAMYDTIDLSQMPWNPPAVAGYVGGKWRTFPELAKHFPRAKLLSIAVFAIQDADCLDVENGDATPAQVPAWVKRQKARGVLRPCIYASLNAMPEILAQLAHAGISRHNVRLWVAHYTYAPHIPAGFDACQWSDRAFGRNLDVSLCEPTFL